MKRLDAAIVAAGLPAAAIGWRVASTGEGRFLAVMTTIAAVLGGLALNHAITRRPHLVVSYRNPDADGRPVVWRALPPKQSSYLLVRLDNDGPGAARAIEVDFDSLGVEIWNESGNFPGPYVDATVHPPRFIGRERVLGPGDHWTLARLHAISNDWPAGTVRWRARADGMPEQTGEVEITMLDGPPG
jgi:hypothetical protein